jgi:hypothetical protein
MPGGTKRRGKSISPSPRDLGALERYEGRKSLPIHSGSPSIFTRSGCGPVQSPPTHPGGDFSSTFGSALTARAYARARGVRSAVRHPTFGRVLAKANCDKTSAKYSPAQGVPPLHYRKVYEEYPSEFSRENPPRKSHPSPCIFLAPAPLAHPLPPIRPSQSSLPPIVRVRLLASSIPMHAVANLLQTPPPLLLF